MNLIIDGFEFNVEQTKILRYEIAKITEEIAEEFLKDFKVDSETLSNAIFLKNPNPKGCFFKVLKG